MQWATNRAILALHVQFSSYVQRIWIDLYHCLKVLVDLMNALEAELDILHRSEYFLQEVLLKLRNRDFVKV